MGYRELFEDLKVCEKEKPLFYFYYYYLFALSDISEEVTTYLQSSAKFSYKSVMYSYYIDLFLFFFKKEKLILNVNCGEKFVFARGEKKNKIYRYMQFIFLNKININYYLKGVSLRHSLFKVIEKNKTSTYKVLWNEIRAKDNYYRFIKYYNRTSNFLKKLKVKEVYIIDYTGGLISSLAELCKKGGIIVNIIPHGYIQNYQNVEVYAANSTQYICWSPTEAKTIKELFPLVKTIFNGSPIYSNDDVNDFRKSRAELLKSNITNITFFACPLCNLTNYVELIDILSKVNSFLEKRNIRLNIKLHPWEQPFIVDLLKNNNLNIISGDVRTLAINSLVVYRATITLSGPSDNYLGRLI